MSSPQDNSPRNQEEDNRGDTDVRPGERTDPDEIEPPDDYGTENERKQEIQDHENARISLACHVRGGGRESLRDCGSPPRSWVRHPPSKERGSPIPH